MPFGARNGNAHLMNIEISEMPQHMQAAPIPADWIIEGSPEAGVCALSHSADTFTSTFIWSCTAGRFHWHFASDETVHILEGEVIVTDDSGTLHHLGPGSTALFRAGSHSVWHVPVFVKKIAFVYQAPPLAVSLSLRVLRKIRTLMAGERTLGLAA